MPPRKSLLRRATSCPNPHYSEGFGPSESFPIRATRRPLTQSKPSGRVPVTTAQFARVTLRLGCLGEEERHDEVY
jgi:hypothetical protein